MSRRRACDRCAELKAQCAEDPPCARCQRLGLQCTSHRPVRARGRPRRTGAATTAAVAAVAAAPPSPAAQLLLPARQLPVDAALAAHVLDHVLASVHRIGILSALRRNQHHLVAAHGPHAPGNSLLASTSMQCILLACGFLFGPARDDGDTLAENCRIHALADIPILTWKSRPVRRADIYCLLILASLGYLHQGTTDMADRWAALANCLECLASPRVDVDDDETTEVHRRVACLLSINKEIQRLLYNRPHSEPTLMSLHGNRARPGAPASPLRPDPSLRPQRTDDEWHCLSSASTPDDASLPVSDRVDAAEGFFDLFTPLQVPLKIALSSPAYNGVVHKAAVDHMEDYFISFPTRLMDFGSVVFPWQWEAMMWFHGIFILLNAGADFLDILIDPNFPRSPQCVHAADHAILLGDLLQPLAAEPSIPSYFNHATIFFVALSAMLHSVLLPSIGLEDPSVRDVLIESARAHEKVLQAILAENRTCDHPVIQAALGILTLNISRTCDAESSGETSFLELVHSLKYYRWVRKGQGLTRLDEESATRLFQATWNKKDQSLETRCLPPLLRSVLDPESRICRSGTFDLSILYCEDSTGR